MKPGWFGKPGWRIGPPRWLLCVFGRHNWRRRGTVLEQCAWCGTVRIR